MQDNSIYDNIKWYQWNYMQSKSCERIKPFTETLKKKKKEIWSFLLEEKKYKHNKQVLLLQGNCK